MKDLEDKMRTLLDTVVGNGNINMAKEFFTKLIQKSKEDFFDRD